MTDKLQYIHQFRERRAVVEAALFLIKEGRFQNSAIRDIAFRARLTESTALHFFPDRATILDEVELYVIHEVDTVVAQAMITGQPDRKTHFENTWKLLYKLYSTNVGILKFIDQSPGILGNTERTAKFFEQINKQLITYFDSPTGLFTPKQAASVFQSSIIGAAKLTCEQFVLLSDRQLKALATSTWNLIHKKQSMLLATLPPAED